MHRHDLDLIAALADGSLTDETEARALIETCDSCRAEYEVQRKALEMLASLGPVSMTEHERSALHRDLWTELRAAPTAVKTSARWYRWSYVAAGLFLLVGIAGVLSRLSGDQLTSGDAATFSEVSSGLDGAEGESTTTAAAGLASEEEGAPESADRELSTLSLEEFAELARQARAGDLSASETFVDESVEECPLEGELENLEVIAHIERDRPYLLLILDDAELDPETPITFIDAETCEVVHVEN